MLRPRWYHQMPTVQVLQGSRLKPVTVKPVSRTFRVSMSAFSSDPCFSQTGVRGTLRIFHISPYRVRIADFENPADRICLGAAYPGRPIFFVFWGTPRSPVYTVEHRENTKTCHLMCHQLPFCVTSDAKLFLEDYGCGCVWGVPDLL